MSKSKVYLVGAGPGDSKLITLRGFELIKNADCIIYDYLVNPDLLKFRSAYCKLIYVGKKAGAHTLTQDKINQLLVKEARVHCRVVRLKGGDPFIFGRGAEEAIYLAKNKIDFDIVPGISSAIAVPAYAGIPITERTLTSTVGFITGHEDPTKIDSSIDWQALSRLGTMVFLMGVRNLNLIVKRLIECGKPKDTPIALIRWGTTVRQKTVTGTLDNIITLAKKHNITSPAIIVAGDTVKLRSKLNWFETKPLFSKRIIVTRTREQASALADKLEDYGAAVSEIPAIKIVSQKQDAQLKKAFLKGNFDWVFFTSQNGVLEFREFLERTDKDSRIFEKSKICAIGTETAKSLRNIGIKPDYVPSKFVAEEIVKHFKNMEYKKSTPPLFSPLEAEGRAGGFSYKPAALILRGKKGRDVLPKGLKSAGFNVTIIDLYDTVIPKENVKSVKEAFKEPVDFVTFTSSSTVENFIKLLGKDYKSKLSGVKLASIGPITSNTLKKFGLKAAVQAKVYTIDGLMEAMVKDGMVASRKILKIRNTME